MLSCISCILVCKHCKYPLASPSAAGPRESTRTPQSAQSTENTIVCAIKHILSCSWGVFGPLYALQGVIEGVRSLVFAKLSENPVPVGSRSGFMQDLVCVRRDPGFLALKQHPTLGQHESPPSERTINGISIHINDK